MLTQIQVTLDGRILMLRGRNILELETTNETREIIEILTEALEQQALITEEQP